MDTWHIVQTNPQCEKKAATEIRQRGHRVYLPKEAKLRVHHRTGEKSVKYRPLMAGYVLARFIGCEYDDLVGAQGVKKIVKGAGGNPYRLKGSVVAAMLRAQRNMEREAADVRNYRMGVRRGARKTLDRAIAETMFIIGSDALVMSGPFQGLEAKVTGITDAGKVRVSFNLLGRWVEHAMTPLLEIIPITISPVQAMVEAA